MNELSGNTGSQPLITTRSAPRFSSFAEGTFERRKEEIAIREGEVGSIVIFGLHLFVQSILYYNPTGLA